MFRRRLLENPGTSLVDIPKLLVDEKFRAKLLLNCSDPYIHAYWVKEYDGYSDRLRAEAMVPLFLTNCLASTMVASFDFSYWSPTARQKQLFPQKPLPNLLPTNSGDISMYLHIKPTARFGAFRHSQ